MAIYKGKPTKDGRIYFFRVKYKTLYGDIKDYSSQKYKTKKEAEHEEMLFKLNNEKRNKSGISLTFAEIYDEYMIRHSKEIKPQTVIKTNDLFKHFEPIKNIKINDFSLAKYNLFRKELESKKLSIGRSNKILALLKKLISYSNKYYNTNDNILKFIDNFKSVNEFKKEMKFFTYEEYKKFDSVINELDYKVFFMVLYFLGLRQGEAQALTWKDINFNKATVSISKTLTTKIKGEKWTVSTPKTKSSVDVLPIPKNVLNWLKKLNSKAKEYKNYSDDWFVFGCVEPFKETTICKKKNEYCKLAGVKQIRVHDFRHSCATFLINNGANVVLVSKYLRHSKVSITLDTYSHLYESELTNITKKIERLF